MVMASVGPSWLDPQSLISSYGLLGVLAIVFAETGLLIGFFLPGDSLLFTVGLLIAAPAGAAVRLSQPLWLAMALISVAAVIGDQVGFAIGRKAGPSVFNRREGRLFRREYVERAQAFFDKYGGRAIILARFVPIVRTFTPVVAGVARMPYGTFVRYNAIGGVLWGAVVTLLGYFLGQISFVRNNIELILIAIVVLSVLPIGIEFVRARRRGPDANSRGGAVASTGANQNTLARGDVSE